MIKKKIYHALEILSICVVVYWTLNEEYLKAILFILLDIYLLLKNKRSNL